MIGSTPPDNFYAILIVFSALMFFMALFTKKKADASSFFTANRKVGTIATAFATSIGWMWADVFFSTSQVGYDFGIFGLAWFALSTILSFVVFAALTLKVRDDAPHTVTLPDYVSIKSGNDKNVHIAMTATVALYQLVVLGLNATISGFILNTAFGFDFLTSASLIVILVLGYSLINGLKTSTYTGVVQLVTVVMIMGAIFFTLFKGLETGVPSEAIYGANQAVQSFWDKNLLLSLAIPISIILLTQPFVDQMIFQRLIALKNPSSIMRSFIITGIICGLCVLLFGTSGFIAQSLSQQNLIAVTDTQFSILHVVNHYLGNAGIYVFTIAFLAVIFSTIDACYCAISALFSYDIYKRYINQNASDETMIRIGRWSMVGAALIGILFSLAKLKILWMLFIVGVIGGSIVVPIIFALRIRQLSAKHIVVSIILSLIVSLPLSIYGNIVGNSLLVSGASIASIVIGIIICSLGAKSNKLMKM